MPSSRRRRACTTIHKAVASSLTLRLGLHCRSSLFWDTLHLIDDLELQSMAPRRSQRDADGERGRGGAAGGVGARSTRARRAGARRDQGSLSFACANVSCDIADRR